MRGKTLIFRDATVAEAELILNLRTDEKKGRFLSATLNSLEAQQAWLRAYAASTGQAYFIIAQVTLYSAALGVAIAQACYATGEDHESAVLQKLLGVGLTTLQRWRRQFAGDGDGVDRGDCQER